MTEPTRPAKVEGNTPQQSDPDGGMPVLDLSSKEAQDDEPPSTLDSPIQDNGDPEKQPDTAIEPPTEQPSAHQDAVAKEDYSVFTVPQKRALVLFGSLAAFFSPMTGSIYYPALNQVSLINLIYEPKFSQ
jgi:hypothetical protein